MKKKKTFLLHYSQTGGSRMNQLSINILHRPPMKYFVITFEHHKNVYNFEEESIVDDFLNAVSENFVPENKEYNIHAYVKKINSQNNGDVTINNSCAWVTNVFTGRYFNNYIRREIKRDIIRRIIINGETGGSWTFKMFRRLQIIAVPKKMLWP